MADEGSEQGQGQGQGQGLRRSYDLRPIPDPTELTTSQLNNAILSLKEVVFTRLDGMDRAIQLFNDNLTRVPTALDKESDRLKESFQNRLESALRENSLSREVLDTRFEGADKALKLLQDISDRFPHRIDEKIQALREIHEGNFKSIQKQFDERDTRVDQTAKDTKLAVDAALQAAEKAVQKSELVTSKQIDQQGALILTATDALRQTMDDLKQRLVRLESGGVAVAAAKVDQHSSSSLAVAVIAVIVAIVSALIAAAVAFSRVR